MNDAYTIRKKADLEKLKQLQTKLPGTLEITSVHGEPPTSINLRIRIPTARDSQYPRNRQDNVDVEIQLPERYPFQKPSVSIRPVIWNPNVYASGTWCFGDWKTTETLDFFVVRLMKVIALDPTIIYPASPANAAAARWYVQLRQQQPEVFPSVSIASLMTNIQPPKIAWRNIK